MTDRAIAVAQFKTKEPAPIQVVKVHFNPASLQYTVSNTLGPAGQGAGSRQFVSATVAKLTMDLVFDTTAENLSGEVKGGEDVRSTTDKMVQMLKPVGTGNQKTPPSVEFSWGTYVFAGTVEQYKETLDLFSHDGVPLRASINLTLSSDQPRFESTSAPVSSADRQPASPMEVPGGAGPSGVAAAGGDPRAARAVASANASASLRFGGSASLLVDANVSLGAPAAFASGSLSVGAGVGVGLGASAGLGIGATAGTAFAGLRVGAGAGANASLRNAQALLPSAQLSAGAIGFAPGGMALGSGAGSLGTDVGAAADLQARIAFD